MDDSAILRVMTTDTRLFSWESNDTALSRLDEEDCTIYKNSMNFGKISNHFLFLMELGITTFCYKEHFMKFCK